MGPAHSLSVPQWALPTGKPLAVRERWWSCSVIGQHHSGPHRQAAFRKWWLGRGLRQQWSSGREVEREVRGGSRPSP